MEIKRLSQPPNIVSRANMNNIKKNRMAKTFDAGNRSIASVNAMKANPVPPPVYKFVTID